LVKLISVAIERRDSTFLFLEFAVFLAFNCLLIALIYSHRKSKDYLLGTALASEGAFVCRLSFAIALQSSVLWLFSSQNLHHCLEDLLDLPMPTILVTDFLLSACSVGDGPLVRHILSRFFKRLNKTRIIHTTWQKCQCLQQPLLHAIQGPGLDPISQ
jgi:hypothetical protein